MSSVDLIGLSGVMLVLIAYFLLQTNRSSGNDKKYCLLNLVGSCLILYTLLYQWNTASFLCEICWILISLWGTIKAFFPAAKMQIQNT